MAKADYRLGLDCRCLPGEHTIEACEAYAEGIERGRREGVEAAAKYVEACNDYGFRELAKSIRALSGDHLPTNPSGEGEK